LRAVSPLGGVGFRPAKRSLLLAERVPGGGFPLLSKLFKTNQNPISVVETFLWNVFYFPITNKILVELPYKSFKIPPEHI
jgi:hypothetical protein